MQVFYQDTGYTCGPACLVMALNHYKIDTNFNEKLEHTIWEHCRQTGKSQPPPSSHHTSHPELARYWLEIGGNARLYHRDPENLLKIPFWYDKLERYLAIEEEAVQMGMQLVLKEPSYNDIVDEISAGHLVIIRMNLGGATHQQLIFESDDRQCSVACPVNGLVTYKDEELMRVMEFSTGRAGLAIWI